MDIWQWVYDAEVQLRKAENERLANLIDAIPTMTVNDEHSKFDAIYNEALSLARLQPNKWIEVFIRHWYLQSQVLHRRNSKGMLQEAVELLSFSSQKDTKDCPQSVCSVQDLANCYGVKDGPGYVSERLNVCEETFNRINPSWPCYECIGQEYIDALSDNNEYETALEKITFFRNELSKHDIEKANVSFLLEEAFILIKMGKYEDALKKALTASNPEGGEAFVKKRLCCLALIFAYLGKFDEADKVALTFDQVLDSQTYFLYWSELQFLKAKSDPTLNSLELNSKLNTLSQGLIKNGAYRSAIQIKYLQGLLAHLREDIFITELSAKEILQLIPELNIPLDAPAKSKELINVSKALKEHSEHIENDLYNLKINSSENPKKYIDALIESGYDYLAVEEYKRYLDENLNNEDYIQGYAFLLLQEKQYSEFDRVMELLFKHNKNERMLIVYYWLQSQRFRKQSPKESLKYLRKLLEVKNDDIQCLTLMAELEMQLKNYSSATAHYTRLIELDSSNNSFHWDRIVAATLCDEWKLVRDSASNLELNISGIEGSIKEQWEYIRLQLQSDELEPVELLARRTGPVTALIEGVRDIELPQFFGHEVVFSPSPLNKLDQVDDEGDACDIKGYYTYLFEEIETIKKEAYFFFDIDGVKPEESQWSEFTNLLESKGIHVSTRSNESYQLEFNKNGHKVNKTGVYAYIGVPECRNLLEVHNMIKKYAEKFEHPLIWPRLLSKLKLEGELLAHANIEERYNL